VSGARTLVLDNDDSFTFNLVQLLGDLGGVPTVVVAGAGPVPAIEGFDLAVISPGPGSPWRATAAQTLLGVAAGVVPVLGVCLGLQVIVEAYGGEVSVAPEPRHGKVSHIGHDGKGVFAGLPNPFDATRYHSLATFDVGDDLVVTATSEDGVVQGIRHRWLAVEGVQFHPESILTKSGRPLLANFLAMA
jgi:anthranilate synthase/aminodeoxychorismate synthase-like glutamine amidotransferase